MCPRSLSTMPGGTAPIRAGPSRRGESVSAIATLPGSRLGSVVRLVPLRRPARSPTTHRSSGTSPRSRRARQLHRSRFDRATPRSTLGERVLLLLLAVAIVLAASSCCCRSSPYESIWASFPRKRRIGALLHRRIGLGFIFFEITLIQRLALFLGYPTYSLTVTLASILIFTGLGAFLSSRDQARAPGRVVAVLLGAHRSCSRSSTSSG